MYTQCPECGTIFKVTPEVLRVARGVVRCGVCDATFNAVEYLSEAAVPMQPPREAPSTPASLASLHAKVAAFQAAQPDTSSSGVFAAELARSLRGERASAGSSAAPGAAESSPAGSTAPAAAPAPPPEPAANDRGAAIAGTPEAVAFSDAEIEAAPDSALEFDAAATDWNTVFVTAAARREDPAPDSVEVEAAVPAEADLPGAAIDEAAFERAAALEAELDFDLDFGPEAAGPSAQETPAAASDSPSAPLPDHWVYLEPPPGRSLPKTESAPRAGPDPTEPATATESAEAAEAVERAEISPPHEQIVLATQAAPARERSVEPLVLTVPEPEEPGGYRLVAALAALALALQALHFWREPLAALPVTGPIVQRLYEALGRPIEPQWSLADYDVHQLGAGSGAQGTLRLLARLQNKAARAQPYPLLRVTLLDRFETRLGRREFTPAEYLPSRRRPEGLLPAEQRIDADLLLADPGSEAVSFELDVCLYRHERLSCAHDPRAGS